MWFAPTLRTTSNLNPALVAQRAGRDLTPSCSSNILRFTRAALIRRRAGVLPHPLHSVERGGDLPPWTQPAGQLPGPALEPLGLACTASGGRLSAGHPAADLTPRRCGIYGPGARQRVASISWPQKRRQLPRLCAQRQLRLSPFRAIYPATPADNVHLGGPSRP